MTSRYCPTTEERDGGTDNVEILIDMFYLLHFILILDLYVLICDEKVECWSKKLSLSNDDSACLRKCVFLKSRISSHKISETTKL